MKDGEFREDLYYRLNVFPLFVPPLRKRAADISLLTDYFLEKYSRQNNKPVSQLSASALDLLMNHQWPGNVRELENVIERAVLLTTDGVIKGHDLPPSLQAAGGGSEMPKNSLDSALAAFEKEMIVEALKSCRGNMAKASRTLGLTERKMGLRVVKLGLDPKRFRPSTPAATL